MVLLVELEDGHYVMDCRNNGKVLRWNTTAASYFNWICMWPVEAGKGWTIWKLKNDFIQTGQTQNVNPPAQLKKFRTTLGLDELTKLSQEIGVGYD